MEDLKITASKDVKKDITFFLGKKTNLHFTVNGEHDIEITLKFGWEQPDFMEALNDTFTVIYETTGQEPESVHITKLEEDKSILN